MNKSYLEFAMRFGAIEIVLAIKFDILGRELVPSSLGDHDAFFHYFELALGSLGEGCSLLVRRASIS